MSNTLKIYKKTAAVIAICVSIILMQFALLLLTNNSSYTVANADSSYSSTTSVTLANSNFKSYNSGTSKPYTPQNWVVADTNVSANINAGIISTGDLSGLTGLTSSMFAYDGNLTTADNYTLMLQSNNGAPAHYGYQNGTAMTFQPNSYYKITVLVKTIGKASASIYLTGVAPDNTYNFVGITSKTGTENSQDYDYYTPYCFYVETDTTGTLSAYLELWLGGKGNVMSTDAVFFDNITVAEISPSDYYTATTSPFYDTNYNRTISLKGNFAPQQFENSDFEQQPAGTGWTQTTGNGNGDNIVSGVMNVSDSQILKALGLSSSEKVPGNDWTANNNLSLAISNTSAAACGYQSGNITIAQHGLYLISFWAKTGTFSSGGAFATLTEVVNDDSTPLTATISNISSSGTAKPARNGYAFYSFYVQGSPYNDEQINLTLGLGTPPSAMVKGYVIFDDVAVQLINYATFSSAPGGSASSTLTLGNAQDTSNILNGNFDFASNADAAVAYPLAPTNWTGSGNTANSGIVSLNNANWNSLTPNPGTVPLYPMVQDTAKTTQNVLMLNNSNSKSFASYTSSSFTIAAATGSGSSLLSVEFFMQTQYIDQNTGATVQLAGSDGTILAELDNINSPFVWTKYTIYFKNSINALTAHLTVSVGSAGSPTTGYAFMGFVTVTTTGGNMMMNNLALLGSPTVLNDTTFNAAEANVPANSVVSDMYTENFNNYSNSASGAVKTPNTYTGGTNDGGTTAGVVQSGTKLDTSVAAPATPAGSSGTSMLMILNSAFSVYTFTSNTSYALTSGNYYAFSVWVQTQSIREGEETIGDTDIRTDAQIADGTTLFGAYFSLTGVAQQFMGINTQTLTDDVLASLYNAGSVYSNGWVKYTIYVYAQSNMNVNVNLSMGNAQYPTLGYAFFDNVQVAPITADVYNAVDASAPNVLLTTAQTAADTGENPGGNTPGGSNSANSSWWLLIPTIIIAVALIVALVGWIIRKIDFKFPTRRKPHEYDRKGTLQEEVVKRELAEQRKAKLAEIDTQTKQISKEIEELKADYEGSVKNETSKFKLERMFNRYAKDRSHMQKQLDTLASAKSYITDPNNIKTEENREMIRRANAEHTEARKTQPKTKTEQKK